jgi:hypothetical protein
MREYNVADRDVSIPPWPASDNMSGPPSDSSEQAQSDHPASCFPENQLSENSEYHFGIESVSQYPTSFYKVSIPISVPSEDMLTHHHANSRDNVVRSDSMVM